MKGLNIIMDNQKRDYRGKRALMLLRVSTPEQEKGFGWPAQEREIRRKLLEPLGLKLDEQRHIIRDTYTGLEFRERPALDQILEMARRHEFDVLITDVLDWLGRKGLARELYRMQLREGGVSLRREEKAGEPAMERTRPEEYGIQYGATATGPYHLPGRPRVI